MPLASVFPLVTTRALARPFTYAVPDDVGRGRGRGDPLRARAAARGVVVDARRGAARGREGARRSSASSSAAAGARRARALGRGLLRLDARRGRSSSSRRSCARAAASGARRPRASRSAARPRPRGSPPRRSRRSPASSRALDARRRRLPPLRRDRQRQDRGLPPGLRARARARAGRDRARAGDRARAADRRPLPRALRRRASRSSTRRSPTRSGATSASGSRAGEARVVVGARSAIFAPVRGLGLICVDEEHDASYKQESDPRYDARTVAAKRAPLEGAVAVYGSATPRPESWARLERLELGGRLGGRLPPVRVVDLRRERGYPLSTPLLEELGAVAATAARRSCCSTAAASRRRCTAARAASTRRCPNCDVALVLHRDGRAALPPLRPRRARAGDVPRLRLRRARAARRRHAAAGAGARGAGCRSSSGSASTPTRRREPGALADALAASRRPTARSSLGTQMVAKGHHFAGVALAAVVDADTGLGVPDFRAEERTFQLLTQLAGRSGRDAPGRVLVQTLPARRARRSRSPPATTSPASSPASSSGAASSATRRSATSCASSSPAASRTRRCAR